MQLRVRKRVVLHTHLIGQDFGRFAAKAKDDYLFLRPGPDGDVLGPLQGLKNRLAEFARAVVPDPRVAPNHAWRQRFKTIGGEAGMGDRVLDAIQGHAPRTAGDAYGEVTVKAMADAVGRLPRIEIA